MSSPDVGNNYPSILNEDLFLVFTRFRRNKSDLGERTLVIISTKFHSNSECVWSKLQKRPLKQNFTVLVLGLTVYYMQCTTNSTLSWIKRVILNFKTIFFLHLDIIMTFRKQFSRVVAFLNLIFKRSKCRILNVTEKVCIG